MSIVHPPEAFHVPHAGDLWLGMPERDLIGVVEALADPKSRFV